MVQNICLRAAELGLGSLCMGGYQDSLVNPLIGLDGVKEAVIYSVAVGAAQQTVIRRSMTKARGSKQRPGWDRL